MTCTRWLSIGFVFAALAAAVGLWAHEGHSHRIMGTVSAVRPGGHLEIRTRDGQAATLMLGRETRILKGSSPGVAEDIAVGARVIVGFTEQEDMKMATEVRLAQGGLEKPPAPAGADPPPDRGKGVDEGVGRPRDDSGEGSALGDWREDETTRDVEHDDDAGEQELPSPARDPYRAGYRRGFEDGYRAALEGRYRSAGAYRHDYALGDDCSDDDDDVVSFRDEAPDGWLHR